MPTDPLEPNVPLHPTMVAYKRAFDAALRGNPERAARLAALEAASRAAETGEAFRENGVKIAALLKEVGDELAPAWPQVWYSGKDRPTGSGHVPARPFLA